MAVEKIDQRWTFKAAADLSSKQYTCVKLSTSATLTSAVSGDEPVFPLIDSPKEGEHGTVALSGVAKIKVGTEVKAGELVASKNDGTIQPAASGQYVLGMALETGAAGVLVPVLIKPGSGGKA